MNKFSSRLAPTILKYLEFRKAMGLSDRQERHLASFDAYCQAYYPEIENLSKEAVCGWVSHELANGRGGMYNKVGSLRSFGRYLGEDAYIIPTSAVPKKPLSTPYILTDDELSRLFEAADTLQAAFEHSIKVIAPVLLRLLYTCGLRPQEGRLLKREDINFQTGEIVITKTKGRKERIVLMSDDMLDLFKKYDARRLAAGSCGEYFFERFDGNPLRNKQLDSIVRRCWIQSNPEVAPNMLPRVRPYDLRHRFASSVLQKWIDEGRDLYAMLPYLQAYMGHESFATTVHYIHILPENLLCSQNVDWQSIDAIGPEVGVWAN